MMPRIIVTFSQLVSAWTASNFVHPYGLPRYVPSYAILMLSRGFLDYVGVPKISYYDNLDWMRSNDIDSPRPHTAFIQIPHIDPGRDKYGNQPESLRRVFLLTWMATISIGHLMMEEIENLSDRDELSCRKELCERVIQRYNEEMAPLVEELDETKEMLYQEWRNINERGFK